MPVASDSWAFQSSTGSGRPVGQLPPLVGGDDLLLRHGEAHAAALHLDLLAQAADGAQQLQLLPTPSGVEVGLRTGVGQLRAAAHRSARDSCVDEGAGGVHGQFPHQRGTGLVGQQARRALGQHGRVQRDLACGCVQGLPALVGLRVQPAAGSDERCDVGDGVPQQVAAADPGEVEGLVEVGGALGVERDELDVGAVPRRQDGAGRGTLCLRLHVGGELTRNAEPCPQASQALTQRGRLGVLQRDVATRHGSSSVACARVAVERSVHEGVRVPCSVHAAPRSR